jgi:glutamate synthase domain-containing protein 1
MTRINRRRFLSRAALAGVGIWTAKNISIVSAGSPSQKLNLALVGVAGRGAANAKEVAGENIVALCDVDDKLLGEAGDKLPQAKRYNDWRKMLDQKDIEAVVISTTEHTHALIALRLVFCTSVSCTAV